MPSIAGRDTAQHRIVASLRDAALAVVRAGAKVYVPLTGTGFVLAKMSGVGDNL